MESSTARRPSLMQFGLRDLILTVTVVAVLSAGITPWLRSLDSASQKNFAIRLGLFLGGGLLALLLFGSMAVFARSRRGQCHLTIVANVPRWRRYLRWVSGATLVVLYFAFATGTLFLSRKIRLDQSAIMLSIMWGFMSLQQWMFIRQLAPRFEIFDQGISSGFQILRPWKIFRSYSWTPDGNRLVLQSNSKFAIMPELNIAVPPEQRDEANRVIGQFLNLDDNTADAKRE